MTIKSQLNDDIKNAMREKNQKTLNALRLISAAVKQIEVDERIEVDDARLLVILDKLVKQRHESIQQFQAAARAELVAQEEFELDVIRHYLPEPLSEEAINTMINETIAALHAHQISDMGKVMAELKPRMQGRVDMSFVSRLIKTRLSASAS